MHRRDPQKAYLIGMRDTVTVFYVLRDDFREALINSEKHALRGWFVCVRASLH